LEGNGTDGGRVPELPPAETTPPRLSELRLLRWPLGFHPPGIVGNVVRTACRSVRKEGFWSQASQTGAVFFLTSLERWA